MRTKILVAASVVCFSLIAVISAEAQPKGGMQMPPPPVEVTPVARGALFLNITAVGSLAANESATLRPEVDGQIVKINFEEGQPVKAGDELITLDQSIMSAEARRAQSSASLGDANLRRAQELKKAGYATQRSLDEARTEATGNISAAAVAKVRLDKTIIRAPFDGIAGFRNVSLGDYVRTGDSLMNLEQTSTLKATFQVPETYFTAIKEGTPVDLRVDAYPNEVFKGQIYAINPAIDRQTRSIAIRARIDNSDMRLRPGMFVRVSIPVDQAQTTLLLPETALVPQADKMIAFRVTGEGENAKAERIEVKMGQRNNGLVEVTSGLNEGDMIVVTGQMRVQDGSPVNVVNTVKPKGAETAAPAVQEVQPQAQAPALQPAAEVAPVPTPEAAPTAEGPATAPAEVADEATVGRAIEPVVSPDVMPPAPTDENTVDVPARAGAPAAEGAAQ